MFITFGGYLSQYTHVQRIFYILDILFVSTICFIIGMLLSSIINDYITEDLDRNKSKYILFGQITLESLITIVLIYFVLFIVYLIPSLIKNPPEDHSKFRLIGASFLLTFAIVACQLKMLDKIRFIFNSDKDTFFKRLNDIDENWSRCNGDGFFCSPPL